MVFVICPVITIHGNDAVWVFERYDRAVVQVDSLLAETEGHHADAAGLQDRRFKGVHLVGESYFFSLDAAFSH
ncbi:hypothetical protein SDC9_149316 [bioreactor metagenome]|uniref:Uncharacterized protein n=1 Tax=bioreactor metagenome TaxID=1076179 RepID=A0A645ENI1_9ZZZZ